MLKLHEYCESCSFFSEPCISKIGEFMSNNLFRVLNCDFSYVNYIACSLNYFTVAQTLLV